MSFYSWSTLFASIFFVLACTGGEPPTASSTVEVPPATPAPAPVTPPSPAAEAGTAANDEAPPTTAGDADDAWCCQYDGPLGKTLDLIDNPATCASRYADHNPQFINAPECEPVCCKYAKDPADLSQGFIWKTVAAGNCAMRKGTPVEAGSDKCQAPGTTKPTSPKPQPAPTRRTAPRKPAAAPAPKKPTFRERVGSPYKPKSRRRSK